MNYAIELIESNNLQPADAIVLKKKFLGMVDHFAIFLGYDGENLPYFVANYTKGVRRISMTELNEFLIKLEPTRIERFDGDDNIRENAVSRALSRMGENAYNIFSNNCESYKNDVHYGVNYSEQAKNFNSAVGKVGITSVFVGLAALASKNKKVAVWILGLAALATIAYVVSKDD